MKICFLSIVNIKHMSGASVYTDFFQEQKIQYDIIHIDKYFLEEETEAENTYKFELEIQKKWSKFKKIRQYFKFRKFAKEIIKKNKYDLVIVWGTEASLLFSDYLLTYIKNKYILNIRDYANLNSQFKYLLLKQLVRNSCFTTISSKGFENFLPKEEYVIVNSLNFSVLRNSNVRLGLNVQEGPLKVCFIGYVRFIENDKRLLDALGNDKRFIIQFFGIGSNELKKYSKERNITNIEFVDSFDVKQTSELLNKADIINNLYGNNDIALDTATSIKYFYSIYLNLPILVYKNTHMEKITKEFSFVFDGDYSRLGDRIYEWYRNIDFKEFSSSNRKILSELTEENDIFYRKLNRFIKDNDNDV